MTAGPERKTHGETRPLDVVLRPGRGARLGRVRDEDADARFGAPVDPARVISVWRAGTKAIVIACASGIALALVAALVTGVLSASGAPSAHVRVVLALPLLTVLVTAIGLLARDVVSGRARTPSEIAYWGRAPVIAATDWPRNLRGLDDIVADTDDFAFRASGTTLIVPMGARERVLAQTLADRLDDDWVRTGASCEMHMASPSSRRAARSSATRSSYPPVAPAPVSSSVRPPPLDADVARRIRVHDSGFVRSTAPRRRVVSWDGAVDDPELALTAQRADRVAVVVTSGAITASSLAMIPTWLGRREGVGLVVVDLPRHFLSLPDRVGPVETFWHGR